METVKAPCSHLQSREHTTRFSVCHTCSCGLRVPPQAPGRGACRGCGVLGGKGTCTELSGCGLVPPPHGGVATAVFRALTRYLLAIRGLCTLPCGLSACGREHVHCRCCGNLCLTLCGLFISLNTWAFQCCVVPKEVVPMKGPKDHVLGSLRLPWGPKRMDLGLDVTSGQRLSVHF